MVKPGFLDNDDVRQWLGGIEPARTQLEFDSYCRLRGAPGEPDLAMRIARDLTKNDVAGSALIASTLTLLGMAEDGGIILNGGGNLPRAVVALLAEKNDRPPFDVALIRSVSKVLNEADVWPAELLRLALIEARFLRRQGKRLAPTMKGEKTHAASGAGAHCSGPPIQNCSGVDTMSGTPGRTGAWTMSPNANHGLDRLRDAALRQSSSGKPRQPAAALTRTPASASR